MARRRPSNVRLLDESAIDGLPPGVNLCRAGHCPIEGLHEEHFETYVRRACGTCGKKTRLHPDVFICAGCDPSASKVNP